MQQHLQLERNPAGVKKFLNEPFSWYADLYAGVLALSKDRDPKSPGVFYGALNELDGRFMLVLAACRVDDPERGKKIARVAFELDRMFTLLQLQNSYDSNSFTEAQYRISDGIREKPVAAIRPVFDAEIMKLLSGRRNVDVDKPLQWAYFRNASVEQLNIRFTRYFFARIEDYLAAGTKVEMRHPFKDIVTRGGAVNGFHIEHILARNAENAALFASPDEFEQQRNRLGAVLLLKGRDNQSSGAECYSDKRKT